MISKRKQQEAKNPNTSPERLRELSYEQSDSGILEALTKNPNTPLRILFRLAHKFPQQFLRNPIIPLLFIENPSSTSSWPASMLLRLLCVQNIPEKLLYTASYHSNFTVREAVARNPKTSQSILQRLSEDPHAVVNCAVAQNPKTPVEILAKLVHSFPTVRETVARNTRTPTHLLSILAKDSSYRVLQGVAENPHTPGAILSSLVTNEMFAVRRATLQNPNTPKETLELLYRAGSTKDLSEFDSSRHTLTHEEIQTLVQAGPFAKLLLAKHEKLSKKILLRLAQDENALVCEAVAQNPSTPKVAFQYLINHHSNQVKKAIAKHKNTPASLLSTLATNWKKEIRQAALQNPNTPKETLKLLYRAGSTKDLSEFDSSRHTLTHEEIQTLVQAGPFAKLLLAKHENTPASLLLSLAQEHSSYIQEAVATHPKTPSSALMLLAKSFPKLVAKHKNTPPALLEFLAEYKYRGIRFATAKHTLTPPATLAQLAKDSCREIRQAVAKHKNTPTDVRDQLGRDSWWVVRREVAKHPKTSLHTLQMLCADSVERVFVSAKANIKRRKEKF